MKRKTTINYLISMFILAILSISMVSGVYASESTGANEQEQGNQGIAMPRQLAQGEIITILGNKVMVAQITPETAVVIANDNDEKLEIGEVKKFADDFYVRLDAITQGDATTAAQAMASFTFGTLKLSEGRSSDDAREDSNEADDDTSDHEDYREDNSWTGRVVLVNRDGQSDLESYKAFTFELAAYEPTTQQATLVIQTNLCYERDDCAATAVYDPAKYEIGLFDEIELPFNDATIKVQFTYVASELWIDADGTHESTKVVLTVDPKTTYTIDAKETIIKKEFKEEDPNSLSNTMTQEEYEKMKQELLAATQQADNSQIIVAQNHKLATVRISDVGDHKEIESDGITVVGAKNLDIEKTDEKLVVYDGTEAKELTVAPHEIKDYAENIESVTLDMRDGIATYEVRYSEEAKFLGLFPWKVSKTKFISASE